MDILLDSDTHDIVLEQYDAALVTGTDLIRQRLKQRLWFFLGEWYLAVNDGVPYFQEVLIKSPDRARVESIFKRAVNETEGVQRLTAFELDYDNGNRRLTLNFSCLTDDGEISGMEVVI